MKWNRWGELVQSGGKILAELILRDAAWGVRVFWPEKTLLLRLYRTRASAKKYAERYISDRQKEQPHG